MKRFISFGVLLLLICLGVNAQAEDNMVSSFDIENMKAIVAIHLNQISLGKTNQDVVKKLAAIEKDNPTLAEVKKALPQTKSKNLLLVESIKSYPVKSTTYDALKRELTNEMFQLPVIKDFFVNPGRDRQKTVQEILEAMDTYLGVTEDKSAVNDSIASGAKVETEVVEIHPTVKTPETPANTNEVQTVEWRKKSTNNLRIILYCVCLFFIVLSLYLFILLRMQRRKYLNLRMKVDRIEIDRYNLELELDKLRRHPDGEDETTEYDDQEATSQDDTTEEHTEE